ncbi:MAG: hypothetical protein DRI54_08130, partial [Bacteroidetes bacterium]
MKRILLIIIPLYLSISANAQLITIAEARALPEGSTVTVTGTATNGSEMGIIRYFQDGTAGIAAYGGVLETVNRDDSITIEGVTKLYNGLLEIDPINVLDNHGPAVNPIIPALSTPDDINEDNEGELLQIENAIFVDGGGTFSNSTYQFISGGETGVIYIRSEHELIGELIPVGPVTLIGISSQFTFDGFGGYQMILRDANDLINDNAISIVSPTTESNLSTTGFDLSWTTDVASSTGVWYGTEEYAPDSEMDLIFIDEAVTEHSVTLTGLESGQVYFARVYSVADIDTARTGNNAVATVSESSGEMVVLFNKSVNNEVADPPDNLAIYTTQIDDSVAAWIDKAMVSLDIAIYNFNNTPIANAINAAYDRGVNIRIIVEGSNANIGLNFINQNIPVLERLFADGSGMHNKFMVIDADDVDNAWIMGGATNFTDFNMTVDFNNMIFIQDQSLARSYRVEFNEMWGSTTDQPNAGFSRFGADKTNNTPHNFIVGGNEVELYFSPSDGTTSRIIKTIMDADASVNFATLVFTRDDIADAVIDRSNDFFIDVTGLIDQVNTTGSEYDYLLDNFVIVQSYQDVVGQLHHKYVIIDANSPDDDPTVLTGSHNWSSSAENSNDENTLIIHNAAIANQFYQEYSERYNQVTVGIEEFGDNINLSTFPNPVSNWLYISDITFDEEITYIVTDVSGKVMMSDKLNTISGTDIKIDMSDLNTGLYLIALEFNNQNKTIKIIK